MKRLIPAVALLVLASCGSKDDKSAQTAAKGSVPPAIERVTKPRPKALVQLERRVMGRWRSAAGVLPGGKDQWLVLDIAGTKDAVMEVRSTGFQRESVTMSAVGHVVVTHEGVDLRLPKATSTLTDFKNATGTIVTSSTMRLRTANGREFMLTYDGQ